MRRFILILLISVVAIGLVSAQATKPQTVKLAVAGMKCKMCVAKVDKALRGVEGVKDVKVDLKKQTAVVTLASATVKPEALFKAVDDAGFKAAIGKLPAAPTKKGENCSECKDKDGKKDGDAKKEDCCKPETAKKKAAAKS
ncbi:MAG: heavy metal-associated domain-containing protein [Bacteroidota bacterium]|jgi:copper chaperone CopZ